MSPPAPAGGDRVQHPLRGIALMVAAVSSFAVMEAIVKWLARSYPVPMVTWTRYFLHALLMLVVLWPRMGRRLVSTRRPGTQLLRGAILGLSSMFFFTGLSMMPLAEAGAIAAVTPILVTVLAVRFLGERPPPGTWWALAASFAGVMLIVRPGFGVFAWAALLPVASSFCYAAYQLMTRRLAGIDDDAVTLFIGAGTAAALLGLVVPFFWRPPANALDALLFVTVGAIGWFGHLMLVRALGHAPATLLAPFTYMHLVVALALGALVFGSFPDAAALAGMLAIVLTGVWMALRRRMPVEAVED